VIKTIVPVRRDVYASFPTFACDAERVVVCYREARRGDPRTHGGAGRVKQLVFDREAFTRAMWSSEELVGTAEETTLFAKDNEMDAIVTRMPDGVWSLATRTFSPPDNRMTTYLSLSSEPGFASREPVRVPSVRWLVFFGKGFVHEGRYVFPAYGGLADDTGYRPLLVSTENGRDWALLAALPSPVDGKGLNECSVARSDGLFHLFARCDTPPFGIWHTTSPDLRTWCRPRELFPNAHAPMALTVNGRIVLGFRQILGTDRAAVALADPFDGPAMHLARYEGSIYDGGYADPGLMDDGLTVFYYLGNRAGEPSIHCRRLTL